MTTLRSPPLRLAPAAFAFLVACSSELQLPARPESSGPTISSFDPPTGLGRTVVMIHGARLSRTTSFTSIRFGTSSAVQPLEAAADGSWVKVGVPLDSSSGPITVTTPQGEARGPTDFVFLGPGEPVERQIAATSSLTFRFDAGITLGGALYGISPLHGRIPSLFTWRPGGAPERDFGVASIARTPDGSALFLVRGDGTGPTMTSLKLVRRTATGTREVALPLSATQGAPRWGERGHVATDATGRRAVVTTWNSAWSIDFGTEPPEIAHFEAPDEARWSYVAWLGGTRFVLDLAESGGFVALGVQVLDMATGLFGAPSWGSATSVVRVEVVPGRRLAQVVGDPLRVEVYSRAGADGWELTETLPLDDYATGLALSPDGNRLAISTRDRLTVHALELDGAPALGSSEVGGGGSVTAGEDRFVVAAEDGLLTVSATTGQNLGFHRLPEDIRGALLHRVRCPGESEPREVLDILSRDRQGITRYAPRTLDLSQDCQPQAFLAGSAADSAAVGPNGDLYVAHGEVIERLRSDAQEGDAPFPVPLLDGPRGLVVSPGGRWLAFLTGDPEDTSASKVHVARLDQGWPPATAHELAVEGVIELQFAADEQLTLVRLGADDHYAAVWLTAGPSGLAQASVHDLGPEYHTLVKSTETDVLALEWSDETRFVRVARDGAPVSRGSRVGSAPVALSPNGRMVIAGDRLYDFDPATLKLSAPTLAAVGDMNYWLFSPSGDAAIGVGSGLVVIE